MEYLTECILSGEASFVCLQSNFMLGYVPWKACYFREEKVLFALSLLLKPWSGRHLWTEKESVSSISMAQGSQVAERTGSKKEGGTAKKIVIIYIRYR